MSDPKGGLREDPHDRLPKLLALLDPPKPIRSARPNAKPLTLPEPERTALERSLGRLLQLPSSAARAALDVIEDVGREAPALGRDVTHALHMAASTESRHTLDQLLGELEELHALPRAIPHLLRTRTALRQRLTRDRWREFFERGKATEPAAAEAYFALESRLAQQTVSDLESRATFDEQRQVLHLFAEAITGRPVPLEPWSSPEARAWRTQLGLPSDAGDFGSPEDRAGSDGIRLFLPDQFDRFTARAANRRALVTLTFRQLGLFLCGTLAFDVRDVLGERPGDAGDSGRHFDRFFEACGNAAAARTLFALLEEWRIAAALARQYPGFAKGHATLCRADLEELAAGAAPRGVQLAQRAVLLAGATWRFGPAEASLPRELETQAGTSALHEALAQALLPLAAASAAVADTARTTLSLLQTFPDAFEGATPPQVRLPVEALEDRREHVAAAQEMQSLLATAEELGEPAEDVLAGLGMVAKDPLGAMSIQDGSLFSLSGLLQAEEDDFDRPWADGETSDAPPADEAAQEAEARVVLERVQEIGAKIVAGIRRREHQDAVFHYDEWDHEIDDYRPDWCTLREIHLDVPKAGSPEAQFVDGVRQDLAALSTRVRKQLEQLKPELYRRVHRLLDGDELDLDSAIEAVTDLRARVSPSEKLYVRRSKQERDVAAIFLLDLSASTDEAVPDPDAPAPEEAPAEAPADYDYVDILTGAGRIGAPAGQTIGLSDPQQERGTDDEDTDPLWGSWPPVLAEEAEPRRRVIDVEREAVVLMADALETLGDAYAVYGFSGYGRDGVEFYVAKEFDQPWDEEAQGRVGNMRPRQSTRMGPAIRHALRKLDAQDAKIKALLVLSDGFPQDHDYGRDRNSHEHGIEDTAMALREAELRGIDTFCITVDPAGHDYLRKMCPDQRYLVLEETVQLPGELPKIYRGITS